MANGLVKVTPSSVSTAATASILSNGTVSFTSISATNHLTINGAFSATYENYLVIFDCLLNTGAIFSYLRWSSGGTATTGSDYSTQDNDVSGSTINAQRLTAAAESRLGVFSDAWAACAMRVYNPFVATGTVMRTRSYFGSVAGGQIRDVAGYHNVGASYDGFRFYPQSGASTLSGQVAVFGYTK